MWQEIWYLSFSNTHILLSVTHTLVGCLCFTFPLIFLVDITCSNEEYDGHIFFLDIQEDLLFFPLFLFKLLSSFPPHQLCNFSLFLSFFSFSLSPTYQACTVTGQGAGVAAAVSVKEKKNIHNVDVAAVQKELLRQNVRID